jgi:hypothetical protein
MARNPIQIQKGSTHPVKAALRGSEKRADITGVGLAWR